MPAQKKWIALLRAVLPATHKKMSMQDLRSSCEAAGLNDVSTHAASGNLLFSSSLSKSQLATLLREIITSYGLKNDVILRTPAQLKSVLVSSPFEDAVAARPNLLLVYFYDRKLNASGVTKIISRDGPERIKALNRELCVDYKDGVARSRLNSALIERHLNQPGTARNWNAINKLIELSGKT